MYRAACALLLLAPAARGDELTPDAVADPKGNAPASAWRFWFELAHKPGTFERLDTHSASVARAGVPKKVRGPIGSLLPNPDDSTGWLFHSDWDGRFEGVWADKKAKCVLVHPYAEKNRHLAVAITYTVPADGTYDVSGALADAQVTDAKEHDGIEWIVELASGGAAGKRIGGGGPIGDGGGRPESAEFALPGVKAKKGELVRLVIAPRKHWGSDLTRVGAFKVVPAK